MKMAVQTIPVYIIDAVKNCQVFFVENERTSRRFLKQLWKEMVIDNYEWFTIHKTEEEAVNTFKQKIKEGKTIGIISEAGCPGVADPGTIAGSSGPGNGCGSKAIGWTQFYFAGINGQRYEWPAISFRRLPAY